MSQFKLEIITPEKNFFQAEVESINVVSLAGRVQLLARHISYGTGLMPSLVKIEMGKLSKYAVITGGYLQFIDNNAVIMADAAEWPENIDLDRAKEALERAKARLKAKEIGTDRERARLSLLRAMARIKATKVK